MKSPVLFQEEEEDIAERITGDMKFKVYKDYFLAGAKPIVLFLCFIMFLSGQVRILLNDISAVLEFLNLYCFVISPEVPKTLKQSWFT